MENILVIVSIIGGMCGIAGFALGIIATNRQKRNDRLMFLADRIFDSSIPRELRQPFYEEYISMKGNGTAVRFLQLEGEREKKLQHSA
jgi:hypothetical protein